MARTCSKSSTASRAPISFSQSIIRSNAVNLSWKRSFSTETSSTNTTSASTSTTESTASTASNPSEQATTNGAEAKATPAITTEQYTALETKLNDMTDRWKRAEAEIQNVRRRSNIDIDNARKFAVQSFAKALLEVADTMELAILSAEKALTDNTDPAFKSLLEGFRLTESVMHKAFSTAGIKRLEALGAKFDPNFHEGLFQVDDPTKEVGTVATVLKAGYTLNDRILRAANVGTVKPRS